jgi:hypothetical protein
VPGPLPKLAERRQRRNARVALVPVGTRPSTTPEPSPGLLAASAASWRDLWTSPLAATFVESDVPALRRLWDLCDERARVARVARKSRLVAGSKDQPVLSPLIGYVASLDAEIRQLEDRFGLTPKARLALGVQLGEAHRSLSDLNRAFLEEADAGDAG